MKKQRRLKKILLFVCSICLVVSTWIGQETKVHAVDFPSITVSFDPSDESVIVEGVKDLTPDGPYNYSLEGYLNYQGERIETFCYGPRAKAYDIPEKMAYVFNWKDIEFILPCSGEYKFTCYMTALYWDPNTQKEVKEKGPKTTIDITLHKVDESTNWGPGLPNTTVEAYDLKQIKGKDKTLVIEEPEYSWNIYGKDIEKIPDANISLKVVTNPEEFAYGGVPEFFGNTLIYKIGIEHDGEFGFTAMLRYNIGTEQIGRFAHLFYVVGDGTFEYLCSTLVDENGYALFPFSHASEYIIAVTDEEYTGQKLNPKVEETVEEEPEVAPETGATEPESEVPEADGPETAGTGSEKEEPSTEGSGDGEPVSDAPIEKDTNVGSDSFEKENPENDETRIESGASNDTASEKESGASIGIIGGADGPTAIIVAGSVGNLLGWVIGAVVAVAVVVVGIILAVKRKK